MGMLQPYLQRQTVGSTDSTVVVVVVSVSYSMCFCLSEFLDFLRFLLLLYHCAAVVALFSIFLYRYMTLCGVVFVLLITPSHITTVRYRSTRAPRPRKDLAPRGFVV